MTRATQTILGEKAIRAVMQGVRAVYIPVKSTFGPEGKNGLLYRTFNRGSRISNDGYTAAEIQEPKNPHERLAATAFKEACKRTNEKVGDGTTGTAIFAGELMETVYKLLLKSDSGFAASQGGSAGVMTIKRRILESAEKVKQAIKDSATQIKCLEDLEKVAIVSVEDVELGKVIAKVVYELGAESYVDVVEGYKGEIEVEVIKGQRFPAKIAAKAFVNNPSRYEMVATDCPVLLTNTALDNVGDFMKSFKDINGFTSKLIVVAPSFSENTLVNMVNAAKAGFFIFPVAVPSLRTEQFQDLEVYFDAKFIDKNKGGTLRTITKDDLGFVEKLVVKDTEAKEDAVATGGRGAIDREIKVEVKSKKSVRRGKNTVEEEVKSYELKHTSPVANRIEILKGQLAETQSESFKELMKRRIANMASAVAVIRVGDSTQASALYRKLKIEDAVYACKSALRTGSGYVRGGGLCLKDIAESDLLKKDDILMSALLAPSKQIQDSVEGGIKIGKDIIDPMEAIYYAVEHGAGVVANLATVDFITVEEEDPIHGEGEFAIARALTELVINDKIHKGQLKENEREMERDRMGGLTTEEFLSQERG
jgi:chaperonin GroEL